MWKKDENVCSIDDCWKPVKAKGWCNRHYLKYHKNSPTYRKVGSNKRNHPFYIMWWDRKFENVLCERWTNFDNFVNDISPKPEGNYLLVRLRSGLYGPDNFKWLQHLKRSKTETKKEWYARKWAARQLANPGLERARNFKRNYGITIEEYNEILQVQKECCEICGNKETSTDGKTGSLRRLAIDHCHKSNKIRGLLCWRCNGTLGKVEDSIELLDKMKAYLLKHKEPH